MTERKWWPQDWADEVMPPGRSSPDDFILHADGMWFIGYALDAKDVSESEKRTFSRQIAEGEIVQFMCCDPLGEVEVTIGPDGTWHVPGLIPERATHFWMPGDVDSLADTMDHFVEQYLEVEPIDAAIREIVSMAWWSEWLPHKFSIGSADGRAGQRPAQTHKGAFVAVSAAKARQ